MLIYLASPYSDPDPKIREHRYEQVLEFTKKLITHNLIVYSPIVHSHHIIKTYKKLEEKFAFDFWKAFDTKMISRCDELWILMIDGWIESNGIKQEIEIAIQLSMKIRYVEESQSMFILP